MTTNGIYLAQLVSSHLNNWLSKGRMNITPSFRIYHSRFLPIVLFFICVCSTHIAWAEKDNTVVPELSIDNPDVNTGNTPVWDNYKPQPSKTKASNTAKEGYAKPIATIVPSANSVVQGEVIYFRLEYENAGASFYWLMEDQRGADRLLRVDTSDLKPGKHRVRVSVTNKARQQASSQLIFEVLAKPESATPDQVTVNSPAVADEPVNEATENKPETPIDPVETAESSSADSPSPSIADSDNNEKSESKENNGNNDSDSSDSDEADNNEKVATTPAITIQPAVLSLDQGELASFQSSEQLSNDYEFSWRFGTQLSDLDKFQIATKDVIAGTYKVYLQVTDKEGKKTNVTAQLIVRDPEVDKTEIPNFVGKSIDEIDELLKEAKLEKGEVSQKEVTENPDQVLTQFPRSGTEVNINSKVDLVVGIGRDIDVPEVTGKNIDEANTILAQNDFKVSIEKKIADAEEGIVLSQTPAAGESLKQGGAITLIVAEKKEEPKPEPIKPLAVEIKTTASSVEQGTDVVFNAVLTERIDGEDYRYAWSFGRQTGDQSQFTIKTDDMALGEHSIQLQVKSDKGRVANSEVVLDIREKRLLLPVLKGLSVEEAKKALKKAGLVVGKIEQKEGKVKQATVQQQTPASGQSVSKGQRVDLVVLIPEKEKIAPAHVDMSFDNTVGKAGEPIVFTTIVTTQDDLKDVHYVYNINNTKKASVDQRFVWTPATEGSYRVSVAAYNDGGVIARSKPYTLTIDAGWEKPIAKLLPKKIEVQQGDKVEFISNSTYDLNSTLKYQWVSSSGHNGNKKRFSIDTLGVNAGDYDVTLTIRDSEGNQSTATASFSVQEVLESPAPSVNGSDNKGDSGQNNSNNVVQFSADQKTTQEPSVTLNTSRRIAQIGQNIQFTMQVNPAVKDIETLYYYQLGDKKRRQWMQTAAFEHQYEDFGSYSVRAVIKQNGKVYYSDSVTIWVWSSWLLGMIGGLVLLLLLFIIWWAKRSNEDFNKPSYYHQAYEERIPLLRTDERDEKIDDSVVAVIPEKKEQYDIVTEKREVKHQHPQDSVKSVLLKGVIQFILGILLSFIILYIILKFMGLV